MHVSPFMPMELDYDFILTPPDERLVAHMNTLEDGSVNFDATLTLDRRPWTAGALHLVELALRLVGFAAEADGTAAQTEGLVE